MIDMNEINSLALSSDEIIACFRERDVLNLITAARQDTLVPWYLTIYEARLPDLEGKIYCLFDYCQRSGSFGL